MISLYRVSYNTPATWSTWRTVTEVQAKSAKEALTLTFHRIPKVYGRPIGVAEEYTIRRPLPGMQMFDYANGMVCVEKLDASEEE